MCDITILDFGYLRTPLIELYCISFCHHDFQDEFPNWHLLLANLSFITAIKSNHWVWQWTPFGVSQLPDERFPNDKSELLDIAVSALSTTGQRSRCGACHFRCNLWQVQVTANYQECSLLHWYGQSKLLFWTLDTAFFLLTMLSFCFFLVFYWTGLRQLQTKDLQQINTKGLHMQQFKK